MEAVAERSDTRDQFAIARPRGHFDEQPGGSVGIVAILRIWRRAPARGRRKRREQQNEVEFEHVAIFGLGQAVRVKSVSMGEIDHALARQTRSEEHTSELQSLMRISYAVFCLKKKNKSLHKTDKHISTESLKTNI